MGNTVRVSNPSRSNPREVNVSMRLEMLPRALCNTPNRFGPSPRVETTSTVHLSPTRDSISLMARHSSGTFCHVSLFSVSNYL